MAGTNIETGTWTPHDTSGAVGNVLHPLDPAGAASPGVQRPTAITPASDSPANVGPQVGSVRDLTGERLSQLAAAEADISSAMNMGMANENGRRQHYASTVAMGGSYADGMTLPPSPLDPGVGSLGSGETLPAGFVYDPPRTGPPEVFPANSGFQPVDYP